MKNLAAPTRCFFRRGNPGIPLQSGIMLSTSSIVQAGGGGGVVSVARVDAVLPPNQMFNTESAHALYGVVGALVR